ncbi:MAG TPA: hypothetical protein VLQ80_28320 [Candidatus Saccharimonadia bacterium]|nr:hypothetical protein [Candidatus Saccharimonadia bacterium]
MSVVAPPVRKHLSADALFRLVPRGFDHIPDHRPVDADIAFPDALMAAFAMFSLQAPSLLAFAKERAEGNWHTISGIQRVPCDTPKARNPCPDIPQGAPPGVHECLAAMATRQGACSDVLP